MPEPLDAHGQPNPAYNHLARHSRDISEMIGIVRGILYDGVVSEHEIRGLRDWAGRRPEVVSQWPGSILYERLCSILEDDVVTADERRDLAELLTDLVGGEVRMIGGQVGATTLPIDQPVPVIEIPDRVFVMTGRFAFGPRPVCVEATKSVGGWCENNVTLRTDYVVIGTFSSRDWKVSTFGNKIEKAIDYRTRHGHPAIVSEDVWAAAI